MKILLTGCGGFAGRHAAACLRAGGHDLVGVDLRPVPAFDGAFHILDLREAAPVAEAIARWQPEACLHLGGIAFVPMGWRDPQLTFNVNLMGTLNLLEAFRRHAPRARVVVVTSSEIYGRQPADRPLDESAPLRPENLYAVSKAAADSASLLYARQYGLPVMTARPGNHIGPGQSTQFVAASFAAQLVAIRRGRHAPQLRVGNLDVSREFTDVRDVAQAYRLLLERGVAGTAYNITGGARVLIRDMLSELCRIAGLQPELQVDPELFRPADAQPVVDGRRLRDEIGWRPAIPLHQTLADVFADQWAAAPAPAR